MCEIYAYAGKRAGSFAEELKEFFSHSEEHPNGWGIAVEKDGRMNIEKEPVRAADSKYLSERIEAGVKGNTLIAHIRYATIGSVKYNNCHPFSAVDNSGRQVQEETVAQAKQKVLVEEIRAGAKDILGEAVDIDAVNFDEGW